jgi:hypothetical protein
MGNRGILHDEGRNIVRPWAHRCWICCAMSFKAMDRRPIFRTPPNRYSELFFLDDATALAAGHRPCNYCRREALQEFKRFWCLANLPGVSCANVPISTIDAQLHQERARRGGAKVTFQSQLSELPEGTIFAKDGTAFLVHGSGVREWSFVGYSSASISGTANVEVLTPRSVVAALKSGLRLVVHESAAT